MSDSERLMEEGKTMNIFSKKKSFKKFPKTGDMIG